MLHQDHRFGGWFIPGYTICPLHSRLHTLAMAHWFSHIEVFHNTWSQLEELDMGVTEPMSFWIQSNMPSIYYRSSSSVMVTGRERDGRIEDTFPLLGLFILYIRTIIHKLCPTNSFELQFPEAVATMVRAGCWSPEYPEVKGLRTRVLNIILDTGSALALTKEFLLFREIILICQRLLLQKQWNTFFFGPLSCCCHHLRCSLWSS